MITTLRTMAPTGSLPTQNRALPTQTTESAGTGGRSGSVHRTLDILEAVAARGGCTARELADSTGLPLPTVYRLVRELIEGDYLVHIREEKRFELGYKLHELGKIAARTDRGAARGPGRGVRAAPAARRRRVLRAAPRLADRRRVHRRLARVPAAADAEVRLSRRASRHRSGQDPAGPPRRREAFSGAAAANRCPDSPRRRSPGIANSIEQLATVTHRGVAWEFGEMQAGSTCAAAAVWGAPGWLIGSVAISAESTAG